MRTFSNRRVKTESESESESESVMDSCSALAVIRNNKESAYEALNNTEYKCPCYGVLCMQGVLISSTSYASVATRLSSTGLILLPYSVDIESARQVSCWVGLVSSFRFKRSNTGDAEHTMQCLCSALYAKCLPHAISWRRALATLSKTATSR